MVENNHNSDSVAHLLQVFGGGEAISVHWHLTEGGRLYSIVHYNKNYNEDKFVIFLLCMLCYVM